MLQSPSAPEEQMSGSWARRPLNRRIHVSWRGDHTAHCRLTVCRLPEYFPLEVSLQSLRFIAGSVAQNSTSKSVTARDQAGWADRAQRVAHGHGDWLWTAVNPEICWAARRDRSRASH